ncbi:Xaa-Pro dipeptidase [Strigomonas culicis]|nr:Xaa-Pro dipeptidase [Strigomonas culicis]|eukprot:EPY20296.1 Xaa-Pro dipeptidase [Strigomonas culicis]
MPFPLAKEIYREQRERLASTMREAFPADSTRHAALLMAGAEVPINSTDCNYLFVQESYFNYAFGLEMPDAMGAVLSSGEGIIFIPRLPEDFATWMGALPTPDSVCAQTGADEVHYVDELAAVLAAKGVHVLEVLQGQNSDSGLAVLEASVPPAWLAQGGTVAGAWLYHALSTQRCYKTAREAEVLRYVCRASSVAHVEVMRTCRPGMSQHQLESTFLHHAYYHGGCRKVSYTCICATGHHGATLHYPQNDAPVVDGQMALLDMGGNYHGYAADITCSFPVNGRFTPTQRVIYDAVLEAHDRVLRAVRPGVSWVDMHRLAIRTTCEHLIRADVLRGDVDTLMEKEVMQFFQPHGLGHLLGLDVHDVGGYLADCPARPTQKDCCKLRTARVLDKGFYVTIEPGCYFNHVLLTKALADPQYACHLNEEKIRGTYWNFGGVRIESDVLITEDGAINFTLVPRTVEEIEATMAGQAFHKEVETYKNVVQ